MRQRWKSAIGNLAAALFIAVPAMGQDVEPTPAAAAPQTPPNPTAVPTDPAFSEEDPKTSEAEGEADEPSTRFLQSALIGDCWAERSGLYLYGWASITANWNDNGTTLNYPAAPFLHEQGLNVQQLYFVQGRATDADKFLDFGYRVDMLYGLDARMTGALGLDARFGAPQNGSPYATATYVTNTVSGKDHVLRVDPATGTILNNDANQFALPQLYGEMHLGVGRGVDVKLGHFYTPAGYQVVTAPDNFFVTMPYTFHYGEPFTHTGIFASTSLTDSISVGAGAVRGWDNFKDNNTAWSFLGTFGLKITEKLNYTLVIVNGPEQNQTPYVAVSEQRRNRFLQTSVLQWQMTEKLRSVLQSDYGHEEAGPDNGISQGTWYGTNGYLFYDLTDTLAAGVRGEWFRDQNGTRVIPLTGVLTPGNWYEWALGLNWKPAAPVLIRPELRFDYFDSTVAGQSNNAFGAGTSPRQMTAIVDFIFKF
ncbi:porin [bacterium]|nr:porin [bacterium]